MKEEKIDINEIIKIKQMPIVFEQLEKIGSLIQEATKDIDSLECTEENKQEVKRRRTEINNTLKVLEDKRKEIKTKLLEPYEIFEDKYEKECKVQLQSASEKLKEKIDTIESQQLKVKEDELREFAEQHIVANNIQDVVTFEDIDLNITLSASIKSLKEQILEFVNKVVGDMKLIEMEEYRDEIYVEYLRNRGNFTQSKMNVIERHKMMDRYKEAQQEIEESNKEFDEVVEKVQEVIKPKEIIEDDEIIKVSFTLTGTKEKIKKVKDLIIELGIEYE